jgi:hypothetical protein
VAFLLGEWIVGGAIKAESGEFLNAEGAKVSQRAQKKMKKKTAKIEE